MVPGTPAHSKADHATLDSLNVKCLAVCKYVGIQSTTPKRTKSTNALATAIANGNEVEAGQALDNLIDCVENLTRKTFTSED